MTKYIIIPARGGSKTIPNKNLSIFADKPLIHWSIIQSQKLGNNIFVTSDSSNIKKISVGLGVNFIKRPDKLSGDKASSESAIMHALNFIKKDVGEKFGKNDICIFLQPTSPLRKKNDIEFAIDYFYKNKLDSLFSGNLAEDTHIWKENKNTLKSITFDNKNRKMRQEIKNMYLENGSFYIFNINKFLDLKQKTRLFGKIGIYLLEDWQKHEIDTIEDLVYIESLFTNKKLDLEFN